MIELKSLIDIISNELEKTEYIIQNDVLSDQAKSQYMTEARVLKWVLHSIAEIEQSQTESPETKAEWDIEKQKIEDLKNHAIDYLRLATHVFKESEKLELANGYHTSMGMIEHGHELVLDYSKRVMGFNNLPPKIDEGDEK